MSIPNHAPLQLFLCQTHCAPHRLESRPCHLSKQLSPNSTLCQLKCLWGSWSVARVRHSLLFNSPLPQEPLGDRNEFWCSAAKCRVLSFLPLHPRICILPPSTLNAFFPKICLEYASLLDNVSSWWEILFLGVSSWPSWLPV